MQFKKIIYLSINVLVFFVFENLNSTIDNLDTTFGAGNGYVTTQYSQGFQINKVKLQSSGKVIAVGYTQNPNKQAIIARYTTSGTLDNTFGTNGIVTGYLGSGLSTTVINDVAIQGDDSIVVVGYNFDTGGTTAIFTARYTPAGVLDNTFGTNGVYTATLGTGSSANAVALQSDGKIVVVGGAVISNVSRGFILRLTTSGALDTATFANPNGYITPLLGIRTVFQAVVINNSGNIVVAGYYNDNGTAGDQFVMANYTTSGNLDTTFNSPNGFVTGSLGARTIVNAMTLDASNNILVAGLENNGTSDQFFIARYTSGGALDTANFNNPNGYVTNLVGTSSSVNDIEVQADGKIVIGGVIGYSINQATVARYNATGVIDNTFGNNGVLSLNLGNGTVINGLVIQSTDSRIIGAGYETDPTTNESLGLVIRYNKNNTDFINISTIADNGTISTKIPTISGTSSAASATVQVLINGVLVATTATDGSGNWNAGSTINFTPALALPVGANTIQVNLVVSGNTVVSHFANFTVTDNLGEDSFLGYSTATQTLASANTFTNISYNNAPLTSTWTNNGSNTVTCHVTGKYEVSYNVVGRNTAAIGNQTISIIAQKSNAEIAGSQSGQLLIAGDFKVISNKIILNINAGETIRCQFAGSATNVQLAPTGLGTSVSAKMSIIRLS